MFHSLVGVRFDIVSGNPKKEEDSREQGKEKAEKTYEKR